MEHIRLLTAISVIAKILIAMSAFEQTEAGVSCIATRSSCEHCCHTMHGASYVSEWWEGRSGQNLCRCIAAAGDYTFYLTTMKDES